MSLNRVRFSCFGVFISVYVVVNFFLSQLIFFVFLFLGIVMYTNKFETKEK